MHSRRLLRSSIIGAALTCLTIVLWWSSENPHTIIEAESTETTVDHAEKQLPQQLINERARHNAAEARQLIELKVLEEQLRLQKLEQGKSVSKGEADFWVVRHHKDRHGPHQKNHLRLVFIIYLFYYGLNVSL